MPEQDPTLKPMQQESLSSETSSMPLGQSRHDLLPQARKLMERVSAAASDAQTGVDLHMEHKPSLAIQFQKNQIACYRLMLEIIEHNDDVQGRGAASDAEHRGGGNASFNQFNFNGDAIETVGRLLSGQRVVEVAPRATSEQPPT